MSGATATAQYAVRSDGNALTIATTVRPAGSVPVPVAFSPHPYLRLFGLPRAAWQVELPVTRSYPYAQVLAPSDDDVICFGPPPAVSPGDRHRARFTITVERQ